MNCSISEEISYASSFISCVWNVPNIRMESKVVLSETRRGKKSAVIANYRFREYWYLESKGVHNHLPYDDHHVKREEVRDIPILTTKDNLRLLFIASEVFEGGTFSYSPKFFQQLYTIHVHINDFYVPVVYAFLQHKTTTTYIQMWESIRQLCVQFHDNVPSLLHFCSDFEKAAHTAIFHFYPQCRLHCNFHLGQSWFRRIQGVRELRTAYTGDSDIGKWPKWYFGLQYLHPSEVSDGFEVLMAEAHRTTHAYPLLITFWKITLPTTRPISLNCGPVSVPYNRGRIMVS